MSKQVVKWWETFAATGMPGITAAEWQVAVSCTFAQRGPAHLFWAARCLFSLLRVVCVGVCRVGWLAGCKLAPSAVHSAVMLIRRETDCFAIPNYQQASNWVSNIAKQHHGVGCRKGRSWHPEQTKVRPESTMHTQNPVLRDSIRPRTRSSSLRHNGTHTPLQSESMRMVLCGRVGLDFC